MKESERYPDMIFVVDLNSKVNLFRTFPITQSVRSKQKDSIHTEIPQDNRLVIFEEMKKQ